MATWGFTAIVACTKANFDQHEQRTPSISPTSFASCALSSLHSSAALASCSATSTRCLSICSVLLSVASASFLVARMLRFRIQHLTRFGDVSRGYCISGVLSEGCYLLHLLLQLDAPLPQHDLPLAVDDVRQHAPLLLPCCIDLRLKPRGRLLHVLELRHDLVLEVEVVVLEDGLQLGVLGDDGVQALDVGVHVLHAHTQGLYFAGVVGQPEKIDVQTSNRISFHELHLEANPSALQLLRLDTFLVDLPLQIVDGGLQRASGLILCR
eukprot:evm.model.scf_985EXC.3 EVM.evm.TU.scf_985EXC.3   scf_985EXC:24218-26550(-)